MAKYNSKQIETTIIMNNPLFLLDCKGIMNVMTIWTSDRTDHAQMTSVATVMSLWTFQTLHQEKCPLSFV